MRSYLDQSINNNWSWDLREPARCLVNGRLQYCTSPVPAGPGSRIPLVLDRRLAAYYGAPGYYSQNARVNNVLRDIQNPALRPAKLFVSPWDYQYGLIGNVGDWNAQARHFRSQKGRFSLL